MILSVCARRGLSVWRNPEHKRINSLKKNTGCFAGVLLVFRYHLMRLIGPNCGPDRNPCERSLTPNIGLRHLPCTIRRLDTFDLLTVNSVASPRLVHASAASSWQRRSNGGAASRWLSDCDTQKAACKVRSPPTDCGWRPLCRWYADQCCERRWCANRA